MLTFKVIRKICRHFELILVLTIYVLSSEGQFDGKNWDTFQIGMCPVFPGALAPQSQAQKAGEGGMDAQPVSFGARPLRKMDVLVPQDNLLFSEVMRSLPPVRGKTTYGLSVSRIRGDYGSAPLNQKQIAELSACLGKLRELIGIVRAQIDAATDWRKEERGDVEERLVYYESLAREIERALFNKNTEGRPVQEGL